MKIKFNMGISNDPQTLKDNVRLITSAKHIDLPNDVLNCVAGYMTAPLCKYIVPQTACYELLEAKIKRFKTFGALLAFIIKTSNERSIFLYSVLEKDQLIDPETFVQFSTFWLRYSCYPSEGLS